MAAQNTISPEKAAERQLDIERMDTLEQNPMWQEFQRHLREKLDHHEREHTNPRKHALRRAEHLQAVLELRALVKWMEERRSRAEGVVKRWADAGDK